jgi:Cd(II)/Pb(II)-responsive transcriptional regulator
MHIGDVATKTGCSVQTIRFYERKGILASPARTQSNYRQYSADSIKQLIFIKQCRSLDMSIDEIGTLLKSKNEPNASCNKVNAMIQTHIKQVSQRIEELEELKKSLLNMASTCDEARQIRNCGILESLETNT